MCEQTKRYFSPRLVDYVILVGCRHPNKYNHVTQTPELLRRYPLEDHKDFALPPDVIFFCQPEGCINMGHQRTSLNQTTSFVFTLTEKDSNRQRFGICVNFYRHFSRRIYSSSTHNQPKQERRDSSDDGTNKKTDPSVTQDQNLNDGFSINERKRKRRLRNNTLTSICLISHHPFFTHFRECLTTLKNIIDACDERSCAKRTGASRGTSRETVWGILTGQVSECTSSVVAHEVKEIETWILRFLSAPVSIPGKTKILIDILPNHEPMLFALPDHTRFSLVDFPLHLPLELLGVDLCIRVLTLIMLENKVVFQSRDYNALTMSVLAFVALLYPLEYMFPVIPLLPTCMTGAEQLLLIPTPFIIGVPASFFPYKGMAKRKFDDIWIVDLDSNQIVAPRYVESCFDIPELEYTILNNHLRQVLANMSNDHENIESTERTFTEKSQNISGRSSLPSISQSQFIFGNDTDAVDIAARVAMVRFFNSPNILGGFNEHTRTLRLHPRAVVAFQYTSFIRSRPLKTAFIMRLAKTQAVEFFAEWTLCPDNVAFLRVHTGVYDPALIGDKPKWYSQNLTTISFKVLEESNSLGQAVVSFNAKSNDADCTPTDESGSDSEEIEDDEDDQLNSCYSSLSDFISEMRSSDICGEIRENRLYPENQEKTACVEYATVYKPPEQLQIPERAGKIRTKVQVTTPMNESTFNSSYHSEINVKFDSPLEENRNLSVDPSQTSNDIDSKSSSSTITSSSKDLSKFLYDNKIMKIGQNNSTNCLSSPDVQPKHFVNSLENSIHQDNDTSDLSVSQQISMRSALPTSFRTNNDKMSDSMTTLPDSPTHSVSSVPIRLHRSTITSCSRTNKKIETSNFISYAGQNLSMMRQRDLLRQQSFDMKANAHNENQQFLKEIVTHIQDGLGIGWLKTSRVKKLMEDENYRNFVLSRLNVNLDKRYSDEDEYIEDVKISRAVFKGMITILQAVVQGLESTFENNGVGGMASTFQLFEIAHTHYCLKENMTRPDASPLSERNTPLGGSRESLTCNQEPLMTASTNSMSTSQNYLGANLVSPTNSIVAQLDTINIDNEEFQNIEIIPDTNEKVSTEQSSNDQQTRPDTLPIGEKKNVESNEKETRASLCINSIINDDSNGSESVNSSRRTSKINHHSIQVLEQVTEEKSPARHQSNPSTVKSSLSNGYRYRNGCLIQVSDNSSVINTDREYLFESLITNSRSPLWDQMQTWEDIFLDAVAQERDMIGLDQGPAEMMERYYSLSSSDRKRLEFDEDRLLASMIHNLVGFMLMMRVNKDDIRRKIRRMVGRCHIGLTMSQQINELIDSITNLNGNDIDLRPTGSRLLQKQSFTVHSGTDSTGEMLFMEVWDDCIVLRTVLGEVYDRCWFEKLVNMTFCPKTRVICLWRKVEGETQLNKFYTKRCRDLYFSIKEAMERAASRMKESLPDQDLGGEFPIKDLKTGEGGLLQVCLDGIGLIFENEKEFIELEKIRKCTTQKGDIFVLEQFDRITKQTSSRKYKSSMADRICYSILCVFSYLAAGNDQYY